MYNIEQGRIVWKDIKRMVLSDDELVEYGLVPGDLLVNRVTSRKLVGKTTVFPSGLEPCVYESKNIRVRLIPELANSHYVNYRLLLSGQSHFNYHSQQVVGMASISQPQISTFPLPLAPRAEQDRIISSLHRAFEAIDRVSLRIAGVAMAKVISRYDTLKQAILAKAFRGELVPTEAELARREVRDYEPASVLLERIHAERANSVDHHPASKRKLRKASAHV
jgi:type I restriction enzyme, S subunit